MIRILISLLLTAFYAQLAHAQYVEAGLSVGAANYAGELSGNAFSPQEYHGAIGIFARYNHNTRLAARASVTFGQITGSDANSGKADQVARNLSFRSPIYEAAVLGELNLMPYAIRNNQGSALYLTAGVAAFKFNPQAEFMGEWHDLQPLGTEGQGSKMAPDMKRYSRTQFAIPFGGGAKINLTNSVNIGFEVLVRRTFTDYLDDVSGAYPDIAALYEENPMAATLSFREPQYHMQGMPNPGGTARGNANADDYYMTATFSISFNLTHKQGLDFDKKYDIFKSPPPTDSALGMVFPQDTYYP